MRLTYSDEDCERVEQGEAEKEKSGGGDKGGEGRREWGEGWVEVRVVGVDRCTSSLAARKTHMQETQWRESRMISSTMSA